MAFCYVCFFTFFSAFEEDIWRSQIFFVTLSAINKKTQNKMNKMDIIVDNQFWFSGYFSTVESSSRTFLKNVDAGRTSWERRVVSEEYKLEMLNVYYPEIIHFYSECNQSFSMPINKDITIGDAETKDLIPIHIDKIQISLLPFNTLIYSIGMSCAQVNMEVMLKVFNQLRQINRYNQQQNIQEFVDTVIVPIRELYKQVTGRCVEHNYQLVENGNKLKIYQIVTINNELLHSSYADNLLYSLGTLSMNDSSDHMGSNEEYVQNILTKYKIAVFNNWVALPLLDSMTFMCDEGMKSYVKDSWRTDYFELIYIYQLYRKIFLYRTNSEFRLRKRPINKIQNDLEDFDNHYTYHFISYNFLPNLLNKVVESSQEIADEQEEMKNILKRTVQAETELREKRSNYFLTFLAIITSFSTIWDLNCLLDAMFNYSTVFTINLLGYRLVTSIILLVIVLVALFALNSKRK
jgi:hypothetical protein